MEQLNGVYSLLFACGQVVGKGELEGIRRRQLGGVGIVVFETFGIRVRRSRTIGVEAVGTGTVRIVGALILVAIHSFLPMLPTVQLNDGQFEGRRPAQFFVIDAF